MENLENTGRRAEHKEKLEKGEESLPQALEELKREGPIEFKKASGAVKAKFEKRMAESQDKPKESKKFLILECSGLDGLLGQLTVLSDERLDASNTEMIDVIAQTDKLLQSLDEVGGVLITGSASDIVEKEQKPWIAETEKFIKKALDKKIPVMGVCFGIQLHADLNEREVPRNEGGREMGISKTSIYMEEEQPHPIFKGIEFQEAPDGKTRSAIVETVSSHAYHVEPKNHGETLYGYNFTKTGHGYPMIEIDGSFIGVQFHPEMSLPEGLDLMEATVKNRADKLIADGKNPRAILEEFEDYKARIVKGGQTPDNAKFLQNFVSIVFEKK
ncbi:MAG: hypothetical protein AAB503_01325 [Patescibacteria group bacterium]